MFSVFVPTDSSLKKAVVEDLGALPENSPWIDLVNPTAAEDKAVERLLGIAIPTREDMQEIEISSRLYIENSARYMTATLMCHSDTDMPRTTAVTFILGDHRLVTVRYDQPKPFALVEAKLARSCTPAITGEMVLMELLDAVIDRCADILERCGMEIDQVSHDIFEPESERHGHAKQYSQILISIGRKGDLTSKVRESLVSIGRVVTFLSAVVEGVKWSKDMREQLKTMQRDVASLGLAFSIPVIFIEGDTDYNTPAGPAEELFNQITAPHKEFVWVRGGSHFIPFERPDEFLAELVTHVRPLAGN